MKYTYILLFIFLAFSSCKNGKKGNESNGSAQEGMDNKDASTNESIDPNEVIKNNQSSGSDKPITSDGSAANIVFEVLTQDFGKITEGEQVEVNFKFKNNGGSDLVISHVQAGCGCTTPNWPKDPIKPGQSGVINAKFDSNGRSGHNEKHVTVMSNATESSIELSFTGEVKPKY